jgi:hypothetical protein
VILVATTGRRQRRDSDHIETEGEEMKIAVIGGIGLAGPNLIEMLRRAGYEQQRRSPR